MRILTWNINGIRTIPQYHPWNTLKTHNDILDYLQADIINFQEVKASRSILTKPVATPPSYDSFFSFPTSKSGYSGVATYTRSSVVVPLKAEEGLSFANRSNSLLKPGPGLNDSERVSKEDAYPDSRVVVVPRNDNVEADRNNDSDLLVLCNDLKSLDAEGRVLTLDFGMFVLINVYCPNDGSDERLPFKTDFHRVLEARVRGLIAEGREVILLGDINACAALIDHCEGDIIIKRGIAEGYTSGEEWFWEEKHVRRWLRDLLVTETQDRGRGCLVDIVRNFHPERKGMYTCWNTKISARDSNYGTRIDYILITPNLVPWIKAADIQPQVKGSDHCPVYIDLHDELIGKDGSKLKLKDVLSGARDTKNEPPRLAARFWDEYSGKQKLLSSFFGKKGATIATSTGQASQDPNVGDPEKEQAAPPSLPSVSVSTRTTGASSSKKRGLSPEAASSPASGSAPTKKPKEQLRSFETTQSSSSTTTAKKLKPGQAKFSTFFAQPRSASSSGTKQKTAKGKEKEKYTGTVNISTPPTVNQLPPTDEIQGFEVDMQQPESEEDFLALMASSSQCLASSSQKQKETGEAWRSLMAPIRPPLCTVHREPAKELTVNKPGANKGKKFFVCSRPVGPGYDKGRTERLREDVDPQYKCNFFKWSHEVRRDMRKGQGG